MKEIGQHLALSTYSHEGHSGATESASMVEPKHSRNSCDAASSPIAMALDESALVIALPLLQEYSKGKLPKSLKKRFGESDLVQETLLNAVNSLHQFQGSLDTFQHWLKGVFQNRLRTLVRNHIQCEKRSVRRELSSDYSAQLQIENNPSTLAEFESFKQECRVMEQTFLLLPRQYQQIVELHSRRGMSFRQISLELNQSESAVRRRWSRAILRWKGLVKRTNARIWENPGV